MKKQNGIVLVICMIFICIFATLAVALASMSGTNLQLARNHAQANRAFEAASSGLEITRWFLANDCNNFAANVYHVLDSEHQQGFIVDVNETDSNELTITVTGFAGNFTKQIGGDFHFHENPGWQFSPETYWEK